ncbi:hypothetical protein TNCV_2266561 [Trichonephila clavipes]|nr:hypothetical protein TNCV_2266561 [Trichonephila clavipes]
MNRNTNAELADIHFITGLANGNGRVAIWLYEERCPTRRQPNPQTFAWGCVSVHAFQQLWFLRMFSTTLPNLYLAFGDTLYMHVSYRCAESSFIYEWSWSQIRDWRLVS